MNGYGVASWLPALVLIARLLAVHCKDRQILVFGGNGFIGADTVEKFVQDGDMVTMVNRGNWYWDSKVRILPHVRHIQCDRKVEINECAELVGAVADTEKYDAVVDFSGFSGHETTEASRLLKDKVDLYILISTDSVYDVCEKEHSGPSKETDSVRPGSKDEIELRRHYHYYGHSKLEAEEAILEQRVSSGFPFVILRLPDVLGPRDNTYRFWIYQLWIQLAAAIPERPVIIPHFLQNYELSFAYSYDVADVVLRLLEMGPQVRDQAINLAYPETQTLESFLRDVHDALGMTTDVFQLQEAAETNHLYFYPSVRKGPVDVSKAESLLDWKPTPWNQMIEDTVQFYENAMRDEKYAMQRDEIIQIVGTQIYGEDTEPVYEALEKIYNIDLHHFKPKKDEL